MNRISRIFPSPEALAEALSLRIAEMIKKKLRQKPYVTLALSGGSTPQILFNSLADKYSNSIKWEQTHFFWADERCVPPGDRESNYGMTTNLLLSRIKIPEKNIHRIMGEADPQEESVRYSKEILECTSHQSGFPVFDIMILGMGADGHTASIFPGALYLFDTDRICAVSVHPSSGQKRITITGKVINNADTIFLVVTGTSKADTIKRVFSKNGDIPDFPVTHIIPLKGRVEWWLDRNAATFIV